MDLRDVIASESEYLPAEACLGKICAEIRYMCPPGFPILLMGEVILKEHIALLGDDNKIKVLKND